MREITARASRLVYLYISTREMRRGVSFELPTDGNNSKKKYIDELELIYMLFIGLQ